MAAKSSVYHLGIEITDHAIKLVQRNLTMNEIDLIHIEPLSAPQVKPKGIWRRPSRRSPNCTAKA